MRSPIIFLLILVATSVGWAQSTYSESTEYKPRPEESRQDKRKKKNSEAKSEPDTKPVAPHESNVTGDVTVTIPFSVLDRMGNAIAGLKKEDVTVFVDGLEVPLVSFGRDGEPPTMILVLDSSPSTEARFKTMQTQAAQLVSALPAEMKVMLVDFNTKLNVRTEPTVDRKETQSEISKMKMGDGTSIYSAVKFLYETITPPMTGNKVIVLMTDGVDTTSQKSTFAESLTHVEKDDVTIYPIYFDTFGDNIRSKQTPDWISEILRTLPPAPGSSETEYKKALLYLQDLAAASGGRVFSSKKLSDGTNSLLGELANRYYATVTVQRKGSVSRPVRVRVNRPGVAVFARGSFVEK